MMYTNPTPFLRHIHHSLCRSSTKIFSSNMPFSRLILMQPEILHSAEKVWDWAACLDFYWLSMLISSPASCPLLSDSISLLLMSLSHLQSLYYYSAIPSQLFCLSSIFGQKRGWIFGPDFRIYSAPSRSRHISRLRRHYCIVPCPI